MISSELDWDLKGDIVMSEHTSTSRRIAFVTGGSGFVGGHLIQTLVKKGWDVRALARSAGAAAAVERLGAESVRAEMHDENALQHGMEGAEAVFHVAAMFKLWGKRKDFDVVNVEGVRTLLDAAAATRTVSRFVAVSAAAVVMGDPSPMLNVDETARYQERRFAPYSSSKAAAEKILIAANNLRPGFETIAIRPPMIWGKGMPMLAHMAETVKKGNWQWVDQGNQAVSTCHVDNLVAALLLAADHGPGGEAYFVADAEQGTLKSVMRTLLATQGVQTTDKSMSFAMAWRIAGVMSFVWRTLGLKSEPPLTRQMLQLIGKPFTVRTGKAARNLGYQPVVTWQQGVNEMA
jgi:nucleoside-diphosphate-sugar epimerase